MKPSQDHYPPPIFRKWKSWYLLVLGFLLFQMVIYYLLTLHFR